MAQARREGWQCVEISIPSNFAPPARRRDPRVGESVRPKKTAGPIALARDEALQPRDRRSDRGGPSPVRSLTTSAPRGSELKRERLRNGRAAVRRTAGHDIERDREQWWRVRRARVQKPRIVDITRSIPSRTRWSLHDRAPPWDAGPPVPAMKRRSILSALCVEATWPRIPEVSGESVRIRLDCVESLAATQSISARPTTPFAQRAASSSDGRLHEGVRRRMKRRTYLVLLVVIRAGSSRSAQSLALLRHVKECATSLQRGKQWRRIPRRCGHRVAPGSPCAPRAGGDPSTPNPSLQPGDYYIVDGAARS